MIDKLRLLDFLKRNWVGILGATIGLIGLIASIYVYESTKKYREPIFIVDPARSYIIDADQLSQSSLAVFRSGPPKLPVRLWREQLVSVNSA